jgi:hypothetical protein
MTEELVKSAYSPFWNEEGRRYNWLSVVIKLDLNSSEFDLSNFAVEDFRPEKHQDAFLEPLIHEYTHFLQNIGTLWGARIFYDLIHRVLLSGCGRSRSNTKMVAKGEEIIESLKRRIPEKKSMSSVSTEAGISFTWEIGINSVSISTGQMAASVDIRTICEAWARCASKLYLGWNDQLIHDHNARLPDFQDGVGKLRWSSAHEYWLIFEYFFQNQYQNVAVGVCQLCAYLMNYRDPESAFMRFADYKDKSDLDDVVELAKAWYSSHTEVGPRMQSWNETIHQFDETIRLGKEHGSSNTSVKEFCELAKFVRVNLREDASLFIEGIEEIRTLEYWAKRLFKIGTPVLAFRDATVLWGPTKRLQQSFLNLMGIQEVLNRREAERFKCLFYQRLPICIAIKDDDACCTKPFMKGPSGDGEGCLFCNSMTMLGLSKDDWQTREDVKTEVAISENCSEPERQP